MSLRAVGGLILAAVAILLVGAAACVMTVTQSARDVAGAEPYCIQVVGYRTDYRPARSWLDLSPFAMWAERHGRHHAILIVGEGSLPRLYHWSYRDHAFKPGIVNDRLAAWPALTCKPERDFALTGLALFPEPAAHSDYIRFPAQGTYRIPILWQARWNGGMAPTLILATTAPEFQPLRRRWTDLSPAERDSNWLLVGWNAGWTSGVMKSRPAGAPEQGTEFGLSKVKFTTHDGRGEQRVQYRYYADSDDHDTGKTVIDCGTPSDRLPKSCQHRFSNNGRDFNFRHRPEDVADWRAMQKRVLDLLDVFKDRNS
jgi:hypothetical protein